MEQRKIYCSNKCRHKSSNQNRLKKWGYGYNPDYDFIVISKTGKIGQIIEIQNQYNNKKYFYFTLDKLRFNAYIVYTLVGWWLYIYIIYYYLYKYNLQYTSRV